MVLPRVVAFDELLEVEEPHQLLGGKGAGLCEMTQRLSLPVPPGFVLTTDVCRAYLAEGWPRSLDARVDAHLERLGRALGRRFGDPESPLLLAVRSGAPVSMPGMMDTVLDVGMTPAIREQLASATSDAVFAADTWLRFSRMYSEIVLGCPKPEVDRVAAHDGSEAGLSAAAERVRELAAAHASPGIPDTPHAQLRGAIEAVFRSFHGERARVFRAREGIADDLGTAVVVQAMVFGNLGPRSGTGVVFTRDPATGDAVPFGDYLPCAQGEDVVAGARSVHGLHVLRTQLPDVHAELLATLQRLEHHYRDMCDVEVTVSEGRLFVLQTRVARRSPVAAVRTAVAMAEDAAFPLTRREAVARVGQDVLHRVAAIGRVDPHHAPIGRGLAASPGVGTGVLCCDPDRAAELAASGTAVILARCETSPADVHGMVGAAGLVTTLGGVASHAAVVARGWAIPAVTSLADADVETDGLRVGERRIAAGEVVTLCGTTGALYLGDARQADAHELPEARTLREWAAELGVEPGTPLAESGADAGAVAPSSSRRAPPALLELARVVQLKGLCRVERLAAALGADTRAVEELLEAHAPRFRVIPRGVALTPDGRAWVLEQLGEERARVERARVEPCYAAFVELNAHFKSIVSRWQADSVEGHTPEAWAALCDAVEQLHQQARPIVASASALVPRLARHADRFEAALAAMRAGDVSMLASPLEDSYHTVWFELHEELMHVSGRDRAVEEAAGR